MFEADLLCFHVPKSDSLTSPFEFYNRIYGLRGANQIRIKAFSSNKAHGSKQQTHFLVTYNEDVAWLYISMLC